MRKDLFNTSFYSYNLYSGFFVPAGVTFVLAIQGSTLGHEAGESLADIVSESEEHSGSLSYHWLLWVMTAHHFG